MNVKEFLEYRTKCPLCNSSNLKFQMGRYNNSQVGKYSNKSDEHKYENDRLLITRDMRGLSKGDKHYHIEYSFDLYSSSFQIEIYTDKGIKFEDYVPISLLVKYKVLDANLKSQIFIKECRNCNRYSYNSNSFFFYYKAKNIGNLQIQNEYFGLIKPRKNDYRIFRMNNNYLNDETSVQIFDSGLIEMAYEQCYFQGDPAPPLYLNIIPFISETETADRIDNLLIFS